MEISKTLLLLSRFVFYVIQILVKFVTNDAEKKNYVLSFCAGNRSTRCQRRPTSSLSIVPWNNFGKCFSSSKSKVRRGKETVDITDNKATIRQWLITFVVYPSTSCPLNYATWCFIWSFINICEDLLFRCPFVVC